jgi:hypothetical protein
MILFVIDFDFLENQILNLMGKWIFTYKLMKCKSICLIRKINILIHIIYLDK